MSWANPKKTPYTAIGIKRVLCARCKKNRACYQWNICSVLGFHGICAHCDIELNRMVLQFMRHPDTKKLIAKYICVIEADQRASI